MTESPPPDAALTFAPEGPEALPLWVTSPETLDEDLGRLPPEGAAWARAMGFAASAGEVLVLPGAEGRPVGALIGQGRAAARARQRFVLGAGAGRLPAGTWRLATDLPPEERDEAALGWLLESYRFGRYRKAEAPRARLVAPAGADAPRLQTIAAAEALTRDLINTPAQDLGPADLEAAVRALAADHGATVSVITGEDLLSANFPLIHAVGRAAALPARAPRLIEMTWGRAGPLFTLIGKGVTFDTGGLDIKPAASMGLMKKDMGGAATALGLARMICALDLPLRLRLLIPAVENSIGPDSFRPGDILPSRKGLTVEINNTDAEGRLILADALALAGEGEAPALTVTFATLTGAARVALGPDLPPFFTDDDSVADPLARAARAVRDPLWRLPFHAPYEGQIEPGIADLDNAPGGGMAGAITAALFLRRFAPARYLHLDVYGWQPVAAPGRPKGGVGQGARALLAALPEVLGL